MANKTGNRIHDPARQPGRQAEARAARRQTYKGMTPAQIVGNMSDADLTKAAKRCGGSEMAILEQAWRHGRAEIYNEHNLERSDFERTCMIEAEIPGDGGDLR